MSASEAGHPLFLPDETDDPDEPPVAVGAIHVRRLGQGGWTTHPRTFEPHELTSIEQLHLMAGGGTYELIARGADKRRFSAKRSFTLPGPALPFPSAGGEAAPGGAAALPVMLPQGGGGGDANTALILGIMQMMTQQSIAAQAAQSAQTAAMMQAFAAIAGKRDDGGMSAVLAASMAQTTSIMQAAMAQSGDRTPSEMLTTGIEMGASMARGQAEGAAAQSAPADELAMVVEGMKAVASMNGGPRPDPAQLATERAGAPGTVPR